MPYQKESLGPEEANKLRVLCAEDDPSVATALKRALGICGHFVECARDGADAVERIQAHPDLFDVVITDNQMPRTNGLGLIENLRANGYGGRIMVHCSALSPAESKAYRALRVDYVFEKPTQSAALVRFIAGFTRDGHQTAGPKHPPAR